MRLSGKRAVITGGARGIGAAIARVFVREGARVCINTLEPGSSCNALIEELKALSASGGDAFACRADVRDETQIKAMFETSAYVMGGVDILINNAGVESVVSACDLTAAEWDRICDTNLRGVFLCSQSACRIMRTQNGGVIVKISSIHETVPRLGTAHYCASKAGVSSLTRSLALEWARHGIRVVGIAPGAVETEINREVIDGFGRSRFEGWIPLGRLGTTADIAAATLFLASDEASYISGATLTVDGAYALNGIHYDPRSAIGK